MGQRKIALIVLALIATLLLAYYPHYRYPFPRHIDEWHHITEAIKLQEGGYAWGVSGYRIGFQIPLLALSKIGNLVLIYQFLPAAWAAFSALVLFYVVYKKTGGQFYPALFAMAFFASIKSNVNIAGLWFFTPLSFSIPFIFLYVHFFTEGLEKQNKRSILLSLAIMLILLFIHSISVLFAIPFLLIYSLCNFRYLIKERKFFSLFLAIPFIGALFYKFMTKVPFASLANHLINALQFKYGWGVLELENSFFELYSLMGYIFAIIGLVLILKNREGLKKYLAYVLWPITVFLSIMIFRIRGISYLSPYQRNLYYFAISLPMLSAFGLDHLLKFISESIGPKREIVKKTAIGILLAAIMVFTFMFYLDIPRQIELYEIIDSDDYQALRFLAAFPEKSAVMAPPGISVAIYPISGHTPIATYFFYGNRRDSEKFFRTDSCKIRQDVLERYNIKYVLSKSPINCGWKLIYDMGDFVYEID